LPLFPRPNANDGAAAVNKRGVCGGIGWVVSICEEGEVVPSPMSSALYEGEDDQALEGPSTRRSSRLRTTDALYDISM